MSWDVLWKRPGKKVVHDRVSLVLRRVVEEVPVIRARQPNSVQSDSSRQFPRRRKKSVPVLCNYSAGIEDSLVVNGRGAVGIVLGRRAFNLK